MFYITSHKGNKNYSEVPSHPNCNDYYIKITTKKNAGQDVEEKSFLHSGVGKEMSAAIMENRDVFLLTLKVDLS
jgi:hypothetical protein